MQRGNAAPIAAERGNDMSEILDQIWMTSLTTLLSIAVLFLLAKLMGNKQVSQMTMFDYVALAPRRRNLQRSWKTPPSR